MPDDNRKLDQLHQQNVVLTHQVQALLQRLQSQNRAAGNPTAGQQQADPTQLVNAIKEAVKQELRPELEESLTQHSDTKAQVEGRMQRLVSDYPDIRQEGSTLTNEARSVYQRIKGENPGLDEATVYELSVREAASNLGVMPVSRRQTQQSTTESFTVPSRDGSGKVTGSKRMKSRLTPEIIMAAQALGIDTDDPKIRAELNDYTIRFDADRDERRIKYE